MGKFKLINFEMLFGMIVFFIGLETIRKDLIYSNQIFTFLNFYHFYLIPIMLVFSNKVKENTLMMFLWVQVCQSNWLMP